MHEKNVACIRYIYNVYIYALCINDTHVYNYYTYVERMLQ